MGATGPKISSLSARASCGHVGEDGGREEVAAAVHRARRRAAPRAAVDGVVDELCDLRALGLVDQRADVDAGLGAAADLQRAHPLGQAAGERRSASGLVHVEAVGGRAGLAHVAHLGEHRAVDGRVEVGVLEHEERGVAAELHRHPQDLLGRLFDQRAPHLGGAGEGQLARARVLQQRLDHRAGVPGRDHVQHSSRQPGLLAGSSPARASTAASAGPA